MKKTNAIPNNLERLRSAEEQLREKATEVIAVDSNLQLHLVVVECAMDLADMLRQFETDDEDLKVVQVLGMRTFNAFGASLKLAFSGYTQNSALIWTNVMGSHRRNASKLTSYSPNLQAIRQ